MSKMAAVTYFIAGKSNCPFFAKAQRIGEILTLNLPSVAVRIQHHHPSEWHTYLTRLCSRMAFNHQSSPIVYNNLGTLIGGSDAFGNLVKKMYGDIMDVSSAVMDSLASDNFDASDRNLRLREDQEKRKQHQDQWNLLNKRREKIGKEAVSQLTEQMNTTTRLFHSCQQVKATLDVAPEKHSMVKESKTFQKHIETLSRTLPDLGTVTIETEKITNIANNLGSIPTCINTQTHSFSPNPDPLWKLMFLDHQKVMKEFEKALNQMHTANQTVQAEATKLSLSSSSSSSLSSSSTTTTPISKSVSFAALDTQYTPREPDVFYSLPNTPKKGDERKQTVAPPVDVAPMEDAIKIMRTAVEEGLTILKNAKKQLRIDINNANKTTNTLNTVLDPEQFRHFRLRERREVGKNIHLYRFDLPSPTDSLGCPIGKHIFVKIGDSERAYTPVTTDSDLGYFDLVVKVTRDTPMMDLFATLAVGDWLPARGPVGIQLFQETDKFSGIAMFAHGVGLTPMLQIIRHYLAKDANTPIWLLYFITGEERTMMKEELDRLSTAHTRFNLRYITRKPGNHWENLQMQDLLPSLPHRPLDFDYSQENHPVKLLVCGTKNFTRKTKEVLEEIGHREEFIHTF